MRIAWISAGLALAAAAVPAGAVTNCTTTSLGGGTNRTTCLATFLSGSTGDITQLTNTFTTLSQTNGNTSGSFTVGQPGSYTVVLPKLALANQALQSFQIDLVTSLGGNAAITKRTGNQQKGTYTVVYTNTGVLSGTLVGGAAFSLAANSTATSIAIGPLDSQQSGSAAVTGAAATSSASYVTQFSGYLASAASNTFNLLFTPGASYSVFGNGLGNFQRQLTNVGNTAVRITYISRDYIPPTNPPVPEPATWMTMILGFGAVGSAMRRRRPVVAA